jgi:predicted DNA-binding protein
MVVTSFALPRELHQRLMITAVKENAAAAELIREAIELLLAVRERKVAKGGRRQ